MVNDLKRRCEKLHTVVGLRDPFSLWKKARIRETPAMTGHPKTLTPTLSHRERE
jgi:hypothetical protein